MNWHFFVKHHNPKLVNLLAIQALLICSIFSLFFYSTGFTIYYAVLAAIAVYLVIACLYKLLNLPFYILPNIHGAVYVPTKDEDIQTMLEFARVKKGQKSIDLGAGDGRVVVAFAQAGALADGVELNVDMVEQAEKRLAESKVKHGRVTWQNLWDVDLSEYDIVTIYGIPAIMPALAKKLKRELKPGARVISNQYPFPNWQSKEEKRHVFLYIR